MKGYSQKKSGLRWKEIAKKNTFEKCACQQVINHCKWQILMANKFQGLILVIYESAIFFSTYEKCQFIVPNTRRNEEYVFPKRMLLFLMILLKSIKD